MMKFLSRISGWLNGKCLSMRMGHVARKCAFAGLDRVERILFVWNSPSDVRNCMAEMESMLPGTEVSGVCLVTENEASFAGAERNIVCVKESDLRFGGRVVNSALDGLMKKGYGLVMDLSTSPHVLLEYVLYSRSQACVVGMKKNGSKADIVMDGVGDSLEFVRETVRFLSGIKRN